MRHTPLVSRKRALGAAATLSLAVAAGGFVLAPAAQAASVPATLSSVSGPTGGGNTLTVTTATKVFYSGLAVEFQYAATTGTACSAAYSTPVTPSSGVGIVAVSSPKLLSAQKLAVTVPGTVTTTAGAGWNLCVYPGTNTTTSLLAANARYTIAAAPTVSAISPSSGPALGGGTVSITGTNFATGTTAKIGSMALTGITIVSSTTLTGVVPPQAAGSAMGVTVTNTGGNATLAAAYTYTNGIVISPNTTPTATSATDVDVSGVGFSSITFGHTDGTTPDHASGHVYLVAGAYNNADNGSGAKTKGQTAECLNVLVIGDTELICTLNTTLAFGQSGDSAVSNGTYTLTVVSDGALAATGANPSVVSSGSTFTVAPF